MLIQGYHKDGTRYDVEWEPDWDTIPEWSILFPYWDVPMKGTVEFRGTYLEQEFGGWTVGMIVQKCHRGTVYSLSALAMDGSDLTVSINLNTCDDQEKDYIVEVGCTVQVPISTPENTEPEVEEEESLEDRVAALEARIQDREDQMTAALQEMDRKLRAIREPIENVRLGK